MKNFKEGGYGHGGGGFGGRQKFSKGGDRMGNGKGKFGGGQSRGFKGAERPHDKGDMFSATCSTCGKTCEVPFRPSPDKPVYCSACFGKKSQDMSREFRGDRQESSFSKRDARPSRDEKRAPREERNERTSDGHDELKRQLTSLEGKVNRILDMLNAQVHQEVTADAPIEVVKKEKKEKKAEVQKEVPVKKVAKKATKTALKVAKKATKVAKKGKK